MKKINTSILLLAISLLFVTKSNAQEFAKRKTIQVYVSKLDVNTERLNNFIKQYNATISNTDYSTSKFYCEFFISYVYLPQVDSLASKMGYITQNTFNTENQSEKLKQCERRISQLKFENEVLKKQLSDTTLSVENRTNSRQNAINKISTNLQNISNYEIEANTYKQKINDSLCLITFTIKDELSTPNNSKISFVNMPGIEYGLLKIENPSFGISSKLYQSVSVKYMFTRGKSYFNLGVYKALDNVLSDTSRINELFMINFGQDFYPRNFGRGKRQFFNLYTGYQIGGFISNQNNNKNSAFIPNANLSMGLELLKTKHVLIDNKVSYFLPLNEMNRNLRGILYQASFNFVF